MKKICKNKSVLFKNVKLLEIKKLARLQLLMQQLKECMQKIAVALCVCVNHTVNKEVLFLFFNSD